MGGKNLGKNGAVARYSRRSASAVRSGSGAQRSTSSPLLLVPDSESTPKVQAH